MVLVERYDDLAIHTLVFSYAGKTAGALAAEVHGAFAGIGNQTVHFLLSDRWLLRYLGIEEMRSFSDWKSIADNDHLVRFPFMLEGHGGASRVTRYDDEQKSLSTYFSKLPPGTALPHRLYGAFQMRTRLLRTVPEYHEAAGRAHFCIQLPVPQNVYAERFQWELLPLAEYHISGAFVMGEIGFDGTRKELNNGSFVITGTAENERFILPDISVFDDLEQIEDDSAMVRFALTRQKETMSAENRSLMEELIRQRKEAGQRLYVDDRFSLTNVLQYKEDDKKQSFDKVCMIRVENYDILVAYAGVEAYLQNSREAIDAVMQHMDTHGYADDARLYCVNHNTFFLTGTETDSHGAAAYGHFLTRQSCISVQ